MALSLPPLAAAALHIGFGPVLTGYPSLETITTKIKDIYMERVLKEKRHEKNLPYFSFLILLPKNQMDVLYIFLCSSSHHTHLQRLYKFVPVFQVLPQRHCSLFLAFLLRFFKLKLIEPFCCIWDLLPVKFFQNVSLSVEIFCTKLLKKIFKKKTLKQHRSTLKIHDSKKIFSSCFLFFKC